LAIIQSVIRQDIGLLVRSAFGYLPMAFILSAAAIVVTQLLVSVTDDLSAIVVQGLGGGSGNLLQSVGDALRDRLRSGIGVLAASFAEGKNSLLVIVTDDLRSRGVRADELIREIAAAGGGRGGGKPHMAQAGIPDAAKLADAFAKVPEVVRAALARAAA